MRNKAKPGLAVLFAALLGGFPATTAAQCYDWGESATRMSSAMQTAWIDNLEEAVSENESHECYDILSAAHAGAQKASETCGIWWVGQGALGDWGVAKGPPDTPEGTSTIALSKYYQSPAQPITPPDLRNVMVHEAAHASLRRNYFRLRGMSESAWNALHELIRQRAGQCHSLVTHPGLGMRMAGVSLPFARTGVLWEPALAILGVAGLAWGVARRKKRGDAAEST